MKGKQHSEVGQVPTTPEVTDSLTCAAMPHVEVTFKAYPISTAPKNRQVMICVAGTWSLGMWVMGGGFWVRYPGAYSCVTVPSHWAELLDMVPKVIP